MKTIERLKQVKESCLFKLNQIEDRVHRRKTDESEWHAYSNSFWKAWDRLDIKTMKKIDKELSLILESN